MSEDKKKPKPKPDPSPPPEPEPQPLGWITKARTTPTDAELSESRASSRPSKSGEDEGED